VSASTLTLAIPTYRRRDTVVRAVEAASRMLAGLPVTILVADNASDDGTVDALRPLAERQPDGLALQVIAGDHNTGILGNFRRLVEHCSTPYLLLLSDEVDPAARDVIERLVTRLEREAPDVLVPSPGLLGEAVRRSDDIDPVDFWDALNLLSGPVYRVESLRRSLATCDAIAARVPIAGIWNLWPFYLTAVDIRISGGACRWHPEDLHVQRERLETAIEDPLFPPPASGSGPSVDALRARYKTLEARLIQAEATAHYLAARRDDPQRPLDRRGRAVLEAFVTHHEQRLFPTVARRIRDDHPMLHPAFVRGAARAHGLGARIRDPLGPLRGRGLRSRFSRRRRDH
jgi:hypothetical protein